MSSLRKNADKATPYALGLFRIVIGLLFACHGASSLFGIFGGHMGQGATVPTGVWPYWYAAVIQLVAGVVVLSGLFTRPAALIASGSLAFAYFVEHQSAALLPLQNQGEPSAMYCWSFLLLVFTGPGALTLDQMLGARRSNQPTAEVATSV
ncbi:DoxX family membrane protein [Streptomyces sioyaensis]|uniref:DoxX family protein n=1 Tax=Streptomyces sioyaensis TaxID=67364 RepID=UPI0036E3BC39